MGNQGARSAVIVSTNAPYHKAGAPYHKAGNGRKKANIKIPNNGDAILDGGGVGEDSPSVEEVKATINNANLLPIFLVADNKKQPGKNRGVYKRLTSHLGVGAVVD